MSPTPLPTLDQLMADPARVRDLPPEMARDLLLRLIGLQTALLAQAFSPSPGGDGQPEAPPPEDRLLTAKEAAARLGIPAPRIYEMVRRGELPAKRFGDGEPKRRTVRISSADLRAWIARQGEHGA